MPEQENISYEFVCELVGRLTIEAAHTKKAVETALRDLHERNAQLAKQVQELTRPQPETPADGPAAA